PGQTPSRARPLGEVPVAQACVPVLRPRLCAQLGQRSLPPEQELMRDLDLITSPGAVRCVAFADRVPEWTRGRFRACPNRPVGLTSDKPTPAGSEQFEQELHCEQR